ncbi:MAG: DsrE family protein [Nitrososphaerota archaeon]|nr:DsrE family protein [Nitrososphaerota archaeon]MDG7023288.1 DsrE family protein [Nitrososphaerota archaeon]
MDKKVFVAFIRSPAGSSFYLEGVRAALGVVSGSEEHEITIAYLGKGTRCALRGVDRGYSASMLALLAKSGTEFFVEKESLDAQRITESDLDAGFVPASRAELLRMMSNADVTLSF